MTAAEQRLEWLTKPSCTNVGATTVRKVWKRHGLKPHRIETYKLSNDPRFEEKLVDVVRLYLIPPEHAHRPRRV